MDRNRLIRNIPSTRTSVTGSLPPGGVCRGHRTRPTHPRERPLLGALPAAELRDARARLCLGSRPGQLVTVAVGRRREP